MDLRIHAIASNDRTRALLESNSLPMLHNLGVCPPLKPGSFQQTGVPSSLPMGVN